MKTLIKQKQKLTVISKRVIYKNDEATHLFKKIRRSNLVYPFHIVAKDTVAIYGGIFVPLNEKKQVSPKMDSKGIKEKKVFKTHRFIEFFLYNFVSGKVQIMYENQEIVDNSFLQKWKDSSFKMYAQCITEEYPIVLKSGSPKMYVKRYNWIMFRYIALSDYTFCVFCKRNDVTTTKYNDGEVYCRLYGRKGLSSEYKLLRYINVSDLTVKFTFFDSAIKLSNEIFLCQRKKLSTLEYHTRNEVKVHFDLFQFVYLSSNICQYRDNVIMYVSTNNESDDEKKSSKLYFVDFTNKSTIKSLDLMKDIGLKWEALWEPSLNEGVLFFNRIFHKRYVAMMSNLDGSSIVIDLKTKKVISILEKSCIIYIGENGEKMLYVTLLGDLNSEIEKVPYFLQFADRLTNVEISFGEIMNPDTMNMNVAQFVIDYYLNSNNDLVVVKNNEVIIYNTGYLFNVSQLPKEIEMKRKKRIFTNVKVYTN